VRLGGSSIGLGAEVGGCRAVGEVAGKDGLDGRAEDDLSTASLGKSHPGDKDELEGVVEGEPVNGVDRALENGQERVNYPVRQPLSIIASAGAEQRIERVVGWQDEAGNVDQELAGNVEEDEEEIESSKAKDGIDLGNRGLLLKILEHRILGQLLIELRNMLLSFILYRHVD